VCVCVCVCVCVYVCVCVCLTVCDLETSTMRRPRSELGCRMTKKQEQQYTCNIIERRVRVSTVAVVTLLIVTYSKCGSVALFIQHEKRMSRIMSSEACPDLPYIFHILTNGAIFGKRY
jgi:hypothetical protein